MEKPLRLSLPLGDDRNGVWAGFTINNYQCNLQWPL